MNDNSIYAIVDEDMRVARHLSKNTMAVFADIKQLKKHAWRYMSSSEKYSVVELEIATVVEKIGKTKGGLK